LIVAYIAILPSKDDIVGAAQSLDSTRLPEHHRVHCLHEVPFRNGKRKLTVPTKEPPRSNHHNRFTSTQRMMAGSSTVWPSLRGPVFGAQRLSFPRARLGGSLSSSWATTGCLLGSMGGIGCSSRRLFSVPPKGPQTIGTRRSGRTDFYDFHVSVSYSAKRRQFDPDQDSFTYDPQSRNPIPEPSQLRSRAGQDAYFVCSIRNTGAVAIGVTDGVGGYSESGIDSAYFAQAYRQILLEEDRIPGGASTACVGICTRNGQLIAANLGDSGFIILRHGRVLYASPAQTHYFNCPLQLAMVPKHVLLQTEQFGGSPYSDQPDDAALTFHTLIDGDVIIFATDGVWDNLSSQDILRIVSGEMQQAGAWSADEGGIAPSPGLAVSTSTNNGGVQGVVARAVVARAKSASMNTKVDGPFAKEVQRLYPGDNYRGGKQDDIAVVVTLVANAQID